MTRKLAVWVALMAFLVASCSTAINVRKEDYSTIEPDRTYRIVMADSTEYEGKNLVIDEEVATFTRNDERVTVPVGEITLIQQVNKREMLKVGLGLGLIVAAVGGLMVLVGSD
jgi:hypothetical protein